MSTDNTSSDDPVDLERGLLADVLTSRLQQTRIAKRIHEIRPEVINAFSFLSTLSSVWKDENHTVGTIFFLVLGFVIFLVDLYFIKCQWQLQKHKSIPGIKWFGRQINAIDTMDDLLSDLPQTIWVALYLFSYKFSLISMVPALHSVFSLTEDLSKIQEKNRTGE